MTTTALTTRERFERMYARREADRVPFLDCPWPSTVARWHREGMPEGVNYIDYFDLDHVAAIFMDNSPRYPHRIVEETEQYIIEETPWGVTQRNWKFETSTPEFLKHTITDADKWAAAKARIQPTRDRVDWKMLERHYRGWRERGDWIVAQGWFGFDVTHSFVVGTERVLMQLRTDPEWIQDIWKTELETCLALYDMVWDAGYTFDELTWPDDMGFKNSQFFSVEMYRELLKPIHRRAVEWAHAKGIRARLHSCGDVNPFVPELLDIGMDGLNPLEVKAGMDPVQLKRTFGDRLLLHGGINAVLWDDLDAITAEMERVIPTMKESGGYIFASDHSIPSSVSLENFRAISELAKRLGAYT